MALRLASNRIRLRNGALALTVDHIATVTDYLDRAVFQRVGTGRTLTVNMAYSGTEPVAMEARVVDFTSGALIGADWTALTGLKVANGNLSGQLSVPHGCWYRLQVRSVADRATVLSGTLKFGVGIVMGLIGQSNMVGFARERYAAYPISDPRVMSFESGAYKRIGQINDAYQPGTLSSTYGSNFTRDGGEIGDGVIFFTNALSAALNLPILIIDRSVNASDITSWIPGGANWTTFAQAVAAAGGDMEMLLMYQGEQNAVNTSGATMKQCWAQIQAQYYAITGRNASNSHFGLVSLGPGSYNGSQPGQFGSMRAAQVEYSTSTSGAFYVGAAHDASTVDGTHLTPADQGRMGKRWQRSVLYQLGNGASGAGPHITSAHYSGGIVTLTFAHSGGSSLVDGAGGTGAGLTGFEFKDAGGNVLSITSTGIASATTLQFAVSGVPATVSYAMMDAPHNGGGTASAALVPASVVYDNVAPGCPLQPFAAIAIT